jgi:hypothetical protein
MSAASTYLAAARARKNFTLLLDTLVDRILVRNGRAIGVRSSRCFPRSASGATNGWTSGPSTPTPGVALWAWCQVYLRRDRLPERRVVVRFEFVYRGRPETAWLLIERGDAELCAFDPGFGDDVTVTITDPLTFARWHLGHIDWATALRSGRLTVTGPRDLCRALASWNRRPEIGVGLRAARRRAGSHSDPGA